MNLRDYIFKILKEQIFLEDAQDCDQRITKPSEQTKVWYYMQNSGLKRKEICELAVGDPTHNVLGGIAQDNGFDGITLLFLDAMISARRRGIPIEDIIAEAQKQYNDVISNHMDINDAEYKVRVMRLGSEPEKNVRNMRRGPNPEKDLINTILGPNTGKNVGPRPAENEEESNGVSYFDLLQAGDWYHIYRWATYYRNLLLDDVLKRQTTSLHGKELDDNEIILNISDYINIDNSDSRWSGLMHVYSPGKYFAFLFNIDVLSFNASRWASFQPPINVRSVYNIEYKLEKGEEDVLKVKWTPPFILFYKELEKKKIIDKNGNKKITFENIKDLVKEKDYFDAYLILTKEGEAKEFFGQEADKNQKTKISADDIVEKYAISSKYTASFTELIHKTDNKETKDEVNSKSSVPMITNDELVQNLDPNKHGKKNGGPNFGKDEG